MKTIKLFFMMMLFICTSINANTIQFISNDDLGGVEKMSPCTLSFCIQVTGNIGKGNPCKELSFKCLKVHFGHRVTDFDLNKVDAGQCKLIFELNSENEITMSYVAYDVTKNVFTIEEDTPLPEYICKELGFKSVTILKGDYLSYRDPAGYWKTRFKIFKK